MGQNVQPIFILPEGTQRTTGRDAQKMNIQAAKLVAEQVRTTLGPKGMDKMIVDSLGDVTITNDGVTILEQMNIDHPSAKMIVEIAKTQETEVGDGTTTAVVVAGELLKNAEDMLEKGIHPSVLAKGYRLAAEKARQILEDIAEPVTIDDKETLINIALTAMTGKGSEHAKNKLAEILVTAITQVTEKRNGKFIIDTHDIKIEKKVGGSVDDSELIEGIVLDKERVHSAMPKVVKNARIALLNSAIEIKETEIDAKIQITDPMQLQTFVEQEEKILQDMVNRIVNSGANVVLCQKGVDDLAQHFLAKNGIYCARRVKKSDMDMLASATGGTVITNLKDLTPDKLGLAGIVEERKVGEESTTYVGECKNPKAVTILIKGGTEHIIAEVKRALEDAVGDLRSVITNGYVVAGGGATEIEVARQLKRYADSLSGKEQIAVLAFANALEVIPRTLAESAGLDAIDKIAEMKAAHDAGSKWAGIDVFTGKVVDSWEMKVIEPLKIKTQAIAAASEVAIMIVRIDDVVAGSGGRGGGHEMPPGAGGGMGGMPPMM